MATAASTALRRFSWRALPQPFCVLAPMIEVTDHAYRQVVAQIRSERRRQNLSSLSDPPLVLLTEFTSAEGLMHSETSRARLAARHLGFNDSAGPDGTGFFSPSSAFEDERPVIAQLFGRDPGALRDAASFCVGDLGFDGIDINMGCPDKSVVRSGGGSALISKPLLAREIVREVRRGLPPGTAVSVKTRLGVDSPSECTAWLRALLGLSAIGNNAGGRAVDGGVGVVHGLGSCVDSVPDSLTVHLRTRKELSKVPAHWELAPLVAGICKEAGVLSVGNGDVMSVEHGRHLVSEAGMQGFMIGRAAIGNPWALFAAPEVLGGHDEAERDGEGEKEHGLTAEAAREKAADAGRKKDEAVARADYSTAALWKRREVVLLTAALRAERGEDDGLREPDPDKWRWRAGVQRSEVLAALRAHAQIFERVFPADAYGKNFSSVRKHLGKYATGFSGAKELRGGLVRASSAADVQALVDNAAEREGKENA